MEQYVSAIVLISRSHKWHPSHFSLWCVNDTHYHPSREGIKEAGWREVWVDTPGSSLLNLIINLLFDPGESTGQFKGYLKLLLPALKNKSTFSRVLERLSSIHRYGHLVNSMASGQIFDPICFFVCLFILYLYCSWWLHVLFVLFIITNWAHFRFYTLNTSIRILIIFYMLTPLRWKWKVPAWTICICNMY